MVKSVSENKLMTTPATIGITCTSSSKSTAGAISRYGTTPRRSHHCRRGPDAGPVSAVRATVRGGLVRVSTATISPLLRRLVRRGRGERSIAPFPLTRLNWCASKGSAGRLGGVELVLGRLEGGEDLAVGDRPGARRPPDEVVYGSAE